MEAPKSVTVVNESDDFVNVSDENSWSCINAVLLKHQTFLSCRTIMHVLHLFVKNGYLMNTIILGRSEFQLSSPNSVSYFYSCVW